MKFLLIHTVPATPAEVYPYFAELQKFAEAHPFIFKSELLSENEAILYEVVKVAFIPIKVNYKAIITQAVKNKKVIMEASPRKNVKLRLLFKFEDRAGGTRITERVEVNGNAFVEAFTRKAIVNAHRKLVRHIAKDLATIS